MLPLAAAPLILILLFIFYEWPLLQGGRGWPFKAYSAEFFMLLGQGSLWLISTLVHIILVGQLEKSTAA